ncbi:MAG: hypothetical protein R3D69_11960 [Xanthobacteraceae bacterium]
MMRIPTRTYPSQAEIAERIEALERRAMNLPPTTEAHQTIMKELAELQTYAAMKEWLKPITPVPQAILENRGGPAGEHKP